MKQICELNYNDHYTNLCDGLRSMLATSDMSDIVLAAEGKFFKAHQIILSLFSPYFRELFAASPSKQTIFYMKNVKHSILRALLAFMYEGHVQIHSEDFSLFMETANEMQIKGLTNLPLTVITSDVDNQQDLLWQSEDCSYIEEPIVPQFINNMEAEQSECKIIQKQEGTKDKGLFSGKKSKIVQQNSAESHDFKQHSQHVVDLVKQKRKHSSSDGESTVDDNDTKVFITPMEQDAGLGQLDTVGNNSRGEEFAQQNELPFGDGEPVPVIHCISKTNRVSALVCNNYRYYRSKKGNSWPCASRQHKACKARLFVYNNRDIIQVNKHSHKTNVDAARIGYTLEEHKYLNMSYERWKLIGNPRSMRTILGRKYY